MQKTAIVTGASRGIGFETAIALAHEGFDIAAIGLDDPERSADLEKAVQALGRRIHSYTLDISQLDQHVGVVDAVLRNFGSVQCLVNNAGVSVMQRGDLLEVGLESFDRCFDVNTRGTFFFTQRVARHMVGDTAPEGLFRSVIFITSSNAVAATVERGEYCMSKAALSMACKLFAMRLTQHGIGVFEIQPGLILTEMTAPSKTKYDDLIARGMTIDQRWGLPQDVARTVRTMASGLLPYTVAQDVRVDGGLLLTRF
jgi:NAD(P)-dependent dehydrogenase (short-subunit alcohol dehydrogenase family)